MIKKKTTLILGAGASAPFEFPTGYGLLRKVIEIANTNAGRTNPDLFSGFDKTEVDEFREALRRSGKTSVDAFLEHRPDFIRVGKVAMAIALIQCEHEPHLFKRDGQSWYEYLFNQLNARFDDFDRNKLNVLTFNYDRSLEHFLFTALKYSSGRSDNECAKKLDAIPIIHLHGDLGALPHATKDSARAYNTNFSLEALNIAAKRIKIIHEGIENEPQFAQAHKFLSESEIICFLGFGYHRLNMERLGFQFSPTGRPRIDYPSRSVIGSTYGLTDAERSQIDSHYGLNISYALDRTRYCAGFDVFQYLRESGALH